MNFNTVGNGKVELVAGGGKVYADVAARFCHSNNDITKIVDSPYSSKIVENIISSGHFAALEFDVFVFAVSGYSRVCETQLVRKRCASFMISSGRDERNGSREFSIVLPKTIQDLGASNPALKLEALNLLLTMEEMYDKLIQEGVPEEDARYLKPQATEFKGLICMNAHGLLDWFGLRCCQNAQEEIRDMANKMLKICKEVSPDVFKNAGPRCKQLGYCPENSRQNKKCKVLTKDEAMKKLYGGDDD